MYVRYLPYHTVGLKDEVLSVFKKNRLTLMKKKKDWKEGPLQGRLDLLTEMMEIL